MHISYCYFMFINLTTKRIARLISISPLLGNIYIIPPCGNICMVNIFIYMKRSKNFPNTKWPN